MLVITANNNQEQNPGNGDDDDGKTYPHTAVDHSPETKALFVLNGQSFCSSSTDIAINLY